MNNLYNEPSFEIKLGNAVGIALISQFLADIIFSIIDGNIIETDLILSDISIYYGAAASGIVLVLLPSNMDKLELIVFAAVTFQYASNLVSSQTGEGFIINERSIVFDILLAEILTTVFDRKSLNDYYNKLNKRHHFIDEEYETDKTSFEFLFFLFLSNLINYPRRNSNTTKK